MNKNFIIFGRIIYLIYALVFCFFAFSLKEVAASTILILAAILFLFFSRLLADFINE